MNSLADGYWIAEQLRRENLDYYDVLSSVSVRFENHGGDNESALVYISPHLELDLTPSEDGKKALKAVRFSVKSGQYAPPMDARTSAKFFQARRRFYELMYEPQHHAKVQLKAGEMVAFDNRRILHSRTQILPTDGERWMQGTYFDRDGLWLTFERLRRRVAKSVVH
ncbi:unnamed protein product [Durusdinium trenchii]